MKLIQTIKKHLPVSAKEHEKTLRQNEADQKWLMEQLRQATRENLRLQREQDGE